MTQLLAVDEVAERFRSSEKHVRRMIRRGELPCVRIGRLVRVRVSDVEAVIGGGAA
ncbi:helix-turn-helix domain-containing protein [Kineosporia sp. A_224]|uniref:helix-turn-helix domain-containing protein n=1 Tax=Kineosporia sp. A_224 TaxID=1962180 RepID=UPI000B4BF45A|nr:helix-turn-helix domain-containing protein [Kineosporia sp. A_224]